MTEPPSPLAGFGEPGSPSKALPRQSATREGGAALVAAGILLSRVTGLIRQRVFSHYFGLRTDAADAFTAAFRIPNVLQNLFGEGALSASFIPVYAALVARGERREADRVAGAVASALALIVAVVVLAGVLATPLFIALVAPGFHGAKRELTITIVRILFPGAGLLTISAWCLGVLNSHRRFLLSYASGVVWNVAMIATLLIFGGAGEALPRLAVMLAWGSVAGSALQFAVQLPSVFRVAPDLRFALDTTSGHVRTIGRNFLPVLVSRGVVQISAYIDQLIASLLGTGAVTGLQNASTLYTLPVSLFGMSVSAAELPAMSGIASGDPGSIEQLRGRLDAGLRRIAFFIIPSAVAFLALGDVIAGALFQTGRFERADTLYVWGILAGSAVGLLASTLGRLYSSAYYALRDTKSPLQYAIVRVVLTTVLGYVFAIPLPRALGVELSWGAAGLTASAGIAGWVEMLLLRSTLNARIGRTGLPAEYVAQLWGSAMAGAAVAWGVKILLPPAHPILTAIAVLGPYGVVFFAMTFLLRIPEASAAFSRLRR
ncbi:MAG TPA: murein biosynthesis integral membrane protein MurJ [Vicinamibacterales bacterium]|nr:murein biosynthesis integral membrane protein MurJ [Vicinamibacterales bacterium]